MMELPPPRAVAALQALRVEAKEVEFHFTPSDRTAWLRKCEGVFEGVFGFPNKYTEQIVKIKYSPSLWSDSKPQRVFVDAARTGVLRAAGIVEAAIHYLELTLPSADGPGARRSNDEGLQYDPGLWKHVESSVEKEEWSAVAMLVAQYVEHHVREWSGIDLDSNGQPVVGKNLAVQAFSHEGALSLGRVRAEIEGWRNLASGFMMALSNVDRHRIQDREDLKRYALGVLGTGSLILTQIQYQHPDIGR